ncbi:MAG: hypothetical protein OQJ97_18605 [Rhodospirillales bacterium]|nr:hypothetical protein [Rhodospirillales bacterium]
MSKKKPSKVFLIGVKGVGSIYVLARHTKGALSVAKSHNYQVGKKDGKPIVIKTDEKMKINAINRPSA